MPGRGGLPGARRHRGPPTRLSPDRVRAVNAPSRARSHDRAVIAEPVRPLALEAPRAARRLGGPALLVLAVILTLVSVALLASAEWIAPAASLSVPG